MYIERMFFFVRPSVQICSPVCTELEVIVMNWLGKFLDLPAHFINTPTGRGGGIIQGSASEACLIALLVARERTVRRVLLERPDLDERTIRGRLVAYSSDQSNSCIEKSGIIAGVQMRLLQSDENCSMRATALERAIAEDVRAGRFPTCCIATFGTTGTCAYDNLERIGPVCRANQIWLHTDAAYAGAALCCPEYRPLMRGIEFSDSFNFNLHKWMQVNYECTAMWFRDSSLVVEAFTVNRIYLDHKYENRSARAPDYRHWQIALGRRFRSLKVWIVLRTFGAEKLRERIREDVRLAEMFAARLAADERFEVITRDSLALVCFKLRAGCRMTELLIERITERNQIYMIKAKFRGQLIIRFVVCGWKPEEQDMEFALREIRDEADKLFTDWERCGDELLRTTAASAKPKVRTIDDLPVNMEEMRVLEETMRVGTKRCMESGGTNDVGTDDDAEKQHRGVVEREIREKVAVKFALPDLNGLEISAEKTK